MTDEQRISIRTAAVCAGLLLVFATGSFFAANRWCATSDEPLHFVAANVIWQRHDFRVNPEDPPLWQYWCGLSQSGSATAGDYESDAWPKLLHDMFGQFSWAKQAMYSQPGADDFLRRSRLMMLAVSIALGALLARVAWEAAGAKAAIIASVLYCLDPNLMGHASLVKNDIAFSLAMFAFAVAVWKLRKGITPVRVFAVCITLAAGLTTKFSGVLLPGMLVLMLGSYVLIHQRWQIVKIGAVFVGVIGFSVLAIWAVYGFRFAPSPTGEQFNVNYFRLALALNREVSEHGGQPSEDAVVARIREPGVVGSALLFANDHRLLPQAWVMGLMYTYSSSLARPAYLLGEIRSTGWWYYFPLAWMFKTPMSAIIVVGFGAGGAIRRAARVRRLSEEKRWMLVAFGIPVVVYCAFAMTSHLNIGLRHVFPLYPFMFLGASVAFARMRVPRGIVAAFVLVLFIETASGYPELISYFNLPSRIAGPTHLLGDSNIDWGQNLPQLESWRKEHAGEALYLDYFGTVPPQYYGIVARTVPEKLEGLGVVALSSTALQGIYATPEQRERYAEFRRQRPLAIVGGSLYLYLRPALR